MPKGMTASVQEGAGRRLDGAWIVAGLPVKVLHGLRNADDTPIRCTVRDYPVGTLYRMYKTTNSGTTWSTLAGTPDYLGGAGEFASALAVSPTNAGIVYAAGFTGTNSVIRSTDEALTMGIMPGTIGCVIPFLRARCTNSK